MKVFKLDFSFFCGVSWAYEEVEITAISRIQLMKAFLNETRYLATNFGGKSKKETVKDLWSKYGKWISEEDLTFPIILKRNRQWS